MPGGASGGSEVPGSAMEEVQGSKKGDSRRLSLGSLAAKGLVAGMRGLWEQPNGRKQQGMGAGNQMRPKLNPMSQSQDRGLLFKLSEDATTEHTALPEVGKPALATSPSPPASRGSSQPGGTSPSALSATPPSDKKTPKSALKKMWKSMTHRTPKQAKHAADNAAGAASQDLDVCGSQSLPRAVSSDLHPQRLLSADSSDVCQAGDQHATEEVGTPNTAHGSTAFNSPLLALADAPLAAADGDEVAGGGAAAGAAAAVPGAAGAADADTVASSDASDVQSHVCPQACSTWPSATSIDAAWPTAASESNTSLAADGDVEPQPPASSTSALPAVLLPADASGWASATDSGDAGTPSAQPVSPLATTASEPVPPASPMSEAHSVYAECGNEADMVVPEAASNVVAQGAEGAAPAVAAPAAGLDVAEPEPQEAEAAASRCAQWFMQMGAQQEGRPASPRSDLELPAAVQQGSAGSDSAASRNHSSSGALSAAGGSRNHSSGGALSAADGSNSGSRNHSSGGARSAGDGSSSSCNHSSSGASDAHQALASVPVPAELGEVSQPPGGCAMQQGDASEVPAAAACQEAGPHVGQQDTVMQGDEAMEDVQGGECDVDMSAATGAQAADDSVDSAPGTSDAVHGDAPGGVQAAGDSLSAADDDGQLAAGDGAAAATAPVLVVNSSGSPPNTAGADGATDGSTMEAAKGDEVPELPPLLQCEHSPGQSELPPQQLHIRTAAAAREAADGAELVECGNAAGLQAQQGGSSMGCDGAEQGASPHALVVSLDKGISGGGASLDAQFEAAAAADACNSGVDNSSKDGVAGTAVPIPGAAVCPFSETNGGSSGGVSCSSSSSDAGLAGMTAPMPAAAVCPDTQATVAASVGEAAGSDAAGLPAAVANGDDGDSMEVDPPPCDPLPCEVSAAAAAGQEAGLGPVSGAGVPDDAHAAAPTPQQLEQAGSAPDEPAVVAAVAAPMAEEQLLRVSVRAPVPAEAGLLHGDADSPAASPLASMLEELAAATSATKLPRPTEAAAAAALPCAGAVVAAVDDQGTAQATAAVQQRGQQEPTSPPTTAPAPPEQPVNDLGAACMDVDMASPAPTPARKPQPTAAGAPDAAAVAATAATHSATAAGDAAAQGDDEGAQVTAAADTLPEVAAAGASIAPASPSMQPVADSSPDAATSLGGASSALPTEPAPSAPASLEAAAAASAAAPMCADAAAPSTAVHAAAGSPMKLAPLLVTEPVVPEAYVSPPATVAQPSPHSAGSPHGMAIDSPIPMAVSPVPTARKTKSVLKDGLSAASRPRFMPSVSMGTDALVSDLMAALQGVDDDDMQHIRHAAATTPAAAVASSVAAPDAPAAAALGLIDMEMEDVDGGLLVDGLHQQHQHAGSDSGDPSGAAQPAAPRVLIHDVRESLPLFSTQPNFQVSDSMSLERQSLASIEPYSKPSSSTHVALPPAARPAGLMASMLTLDTLQEDECFTGDAQVSPMQLRAARAGAAFEHSAPLPHHSTSSGGGADLPQHLPDPAVLALAASHAPATPLHMPAPAAEAAGSGHASRPSLVKLQANSPAAGLVAPVINSPVSSAGKLTSPDAASVPLKGAAKTPAASARRLSGPMSGRTPSAAPSPAAGSRLQQRPATKANGTPAAAGVALKALGGTHTPSNDRTPKTRQLAGTAAAGRAAMPAAATAPVAPSPVPVKGAAPAPPMPASWATPLAQMQQLPLDFALNAPLMDGSPFPDFDLGDTISFAEEANRMANLAMGAGTAQPAAPGTSLMFTPLGPSSAGAHSSDTPTLVPGKSMGGDSAVGPAVPRGSLPAHKTSTPGIATLSPAAAGFLEAQNAQLMERLLLAEQRAVAAERDAEQLRDQIKTMNFGGMLQDGSSSMMDASDMEREARLCAEEQLQAANAQLAQLQDKVRGLQAALCEEQANVKAARDSAAHVASELNRTDMELMQCRQALTAANSQVSELQTGLQAQQQQVAGLQSELATCQQRLLGAESNVVRLRQMRDDARDALKRSTDENISLRLAQQTDAAKAKQQEAALQASLIKLQTDRDALRGHLAESQAALVAAQAKHAGETKKLQGERDELMRIADQLLQQLEQEKAKAQATH